MPPDEPVDEERDEALTEDNQTPFQPAAPPADPTLPADDDGQGNALDDTHPQTDTGIQREELYDEGISGAAEVEDPEGPRREEHPGAE